MILDQISKQRLPFLTMSGMEKVSASTSRRRQLIEILSKAQFRRRASSVPNLIVIWFDCSTAGKQIWFRRRASVEPNSGFTDASS